MTTYDLSGVEQKIQRAKVHLAELRVRLDEIFVPGTHRFTHEIDSAAGEIIIKVHDLPILPNDLPLIVGDVVHNLRSALDHLAWQMVVFDGGSTGPGSRTYFPVHDSPFKHGPSRDDSARRDVQLDPPISNPLLLEQLRICQPYWSLEPGRAQPSILSPLWQLHRLDIIDNHRIMLAVVSVLDVQNMWWVGPEVGTQPPEFRISTAPAKEGEPVAWFHFAGEPTPEEFDAHPGLQVSVREPELPTIASANVVDVLDTMVWWVEEWAFHNKFRPVMAGGLPLLDMSSM